MSLYTTVAKKTRTSGTGYINDIFTVPIARKGRLTATSLSVLGMSGGFYSIRIEVIRGNIAIPLLYQVLHTGVATQEGRSEPGSANDAVSGYKYGCNGFEIPVETTDIIRYQIMSGGSAGTIKTPRISQSILEAGE